MSAGLNRVMLLGNLGADPELRYTQGGHAVLNMRLAINESYLDRDKQRKERTEWVNVVVWGKRGEGLAKCLQKGSSVLVEGSLRTTSYEKNGEKRYKTEVNATEIILTGGRPSEGYGERQREQRGAKAPEVNPDPVPTDYDEGYGGDIPF